MSPDQHTHCTKYGLIAILHDTRLTRRIAVNSLTLLDIHKDFQVAYSQSGSSKNYDACEYPAVEREALGIEGPVHLSCGIGEAEDLVDDLRAALDGLEDEDSGCESGLVTPLDILS
ncbi:uncharacterized protein F5147DRAFT_655918 [Suillus discolor]|uniref:Uncharacterized protein n=1 Tax=Suillus discolor TaxID=1912936 RepID=A0A9P7EZJ4_9AGAM|nr:uncharacterized protein F5147DRAFT_655918 [Suillus discolor]KAG2098934.1 hypothetical protein F5147DRAFT_655918 [Suillus discolor]